MTSDGTRGPATGGRLAADVARVVAAGKSRERTPAEVRDELVDTVEDWLREKAVEIGIDRRSGLALLAVGGLGRRELQPHSDLDLVLVHDGVRPADVADVADALWYPLWDSGLRLDHSVRTIAETLHVADADTAANFGLLESRHVAGDLALTERVAAEVRARWRSGSGRRLAAVVAETRARHHRSGLISQSVDADLKNGRGGLRDLQLLMALAAAQLADGIQAGPAGARGAELGESHRLLLDCRTALRLEAGRPVDVLRPQYADDVAARLGYADRFALAGELSRACRTIDFAVETGLRTAVNARRGGALGRLRRPLRRPLAPGVVEHSGEVVLARTARPAGDPVLPLRVAAAAARAGLPIGVATLRRLGDSSARLPEPWPAEARDLFFFLLGGGESTPEVIEALDRIGLWARLLPEWDAVRDLVPRDPIHIHTVDRHLTQTVRQAARMATAVSRPDLLLLAALLHDLGKGRAGDHSVVGADLAEGIARRLGLGSADCRTVAATVRHHLLLAATVGRRDVADPAVARSILAALGPEPLPVFELLVPLTEADATATGPGMWNRWRSRLLAELAVTCRAEAAGGAAPHRRPPALVPVPAASVGEPDGVHLRVDRHSDSGLDEITVVAADSPGLLHAAVSALALHGFEVWQATVTTSGSVAVDRFVVDTTIGTPVDPALLRQDLRRIRDGELDAAAALERRRTRRSARADPGPPPAVHVAVVDGETVLEVRAPDAPLLLADLVGVFADSGVPVRWARVHSRGAVAVDVFGLGQVSGERAAALVPDLRRAAGGDRESLDVDTDR